MSGNASPSVRVLVVDGQAAARQGLRALLATCEGIEIVGEARNGGEALNIVQARSPDLVLVDCGIPIITGLELTERLKKLRSDIAVVMISLYPCLKAEVDAAGADAFLVKGCSPSLLVNTIRAVIARRKTDPRPAQAETEKDRTKEHPVDVNSDQRRIRP